MMSSGSAASFRRNEVRSITVDMQDHEQHRTRITAGGNLLPCDGDTSAMGASLETTKIHWNSVISDDNSRHATIDLEDMCLQTPLQQGGERHVRHRCRDIPPRVIEHCELDDSAHDDCVHAEVGKAWCGLKEAG